MTKTTPAPGGSPTAGTQPGCLSTPERVETNFVQLRVEPLGLTRDETLARLREAGVGLSSTIHPTVIRAVTHLDLDDRDIDRAIELAPHALGARVAA